MAIWWQPHGSVSLLMTAGLFSTTHVHLLRLFDCGNKEYLTFDFWDCSTPNRGKKLDTVNAWLSLLVLFVPVPTHLVGCLSSVAFLCVKETNIFCRGRLSFPEFLRNMFLVCGRCSSVPATNRHSTH